MSARTIAVVGTGSAGRHHLGALRAAGARAIAVPLRSSRLTELKAAGYETAGTLEEAAALGASACMIATDTGRHVADALAAVERGLAVLVEKPLAADAAQARPLLAAAPGRVRVGCSLRFSSSLARFRERLPEIGAPHSVHIECRSYLPDWRPQRPYWDSYSARAEDGGVLRDLVHEIDYAGWIFGWPSSVSASLGNTGRLGIASEEWAELTWEARGAVVTVGLDYLSRTPRRGARVFAESGTLEWDALAQTVSLTRPDKTPEVDSFAQPAEGEFEGQAKAFLSSLSGGSDDRLASIDDGWRALALCDAARASSREGRRRELARP